MQAFYGIILIPGVIGLKRIFELSLLMAGFLWDISLVTGIEFKKKEVD